MTRSSLQNYAEVPRPNLALPSQRPSRHLPEQSDFLIYYQNVRSLRSRTTKLVNASYLCNYKVIALTETWLDSTFFNAEIVSQNYNVFRSDRNLVLTNKMRGGGVLLAIDGRYEVEQIPFVASEPLIDVVGVRINLSRTRTIDLFLFYIPPDLNAEAYDILFDDMVDSQCFSNDADLLILGDFNVTSYADYLSDNHVDHYTNVVNNICQFMNLSQFNFIPNEFNRILDLVFSGFVVNVVNSKDILLPVDKHHPPLDIIFPITMTRPNKFDANTLLKFNFRKANFPALYSNMISLDFSILNDIYDADQACEKFYSILNSVIAEHVPLTLPRNSKYPPWFSNHIINSIKQKHTLWKRYKRTGDVNVYTEFSALRQQIKENVDVAYRGFIGQTELNLKYNPNQFWSFLNRKKNCTSIPQNMTFNNQTLTNPEQIVNAFAQFFQSTYAPSACVTDDVEYVHNNRISLSVPTISENDVLLALEKLKPKSTEGPDGLPAYFLKDCAMILAKPLCVLFNLCLKNSIFPEIWKVSRITPVYKKGDKHEIENYRPIVILSNVAKVFEIVIHEIVFSHSKGLIIPNQHGFFAGRSTTTNLLSVTQFVSEVLDRGSQVDIIYTDFSKAFDRLDHGILLTKLSTFGLCPQLLNFFKSYLLDRKLFVQYRGFESVSIQATSGVPQGSVLGPLFFNVLANDVTDNLNCQSLLYADDMKLFCEIQSMEDCKLLQNNLITLNDWCRKNKLLLNVAKCFCLSFTRKRSCVEFRYDVEGVELQRCTEFRDLGVTFDSKLSFVSHVNTIIAASYRNLGFILRNSREFNDPKTFIVLFNAFVRSKLEYASIIWYPTYGIHSHNIEKIQRRFVKYVWFRSDGIYPQRGIQSDLLLNRYNMVSLAQRRNLATVIFLYKLLNNQLDCAYLLGKMVFHVPSLQTRSLHSYFYLSVPRTNVLMFSPVYIMCRNYDIIKNSIDIFNCTVTQLQRQFLNVI